MIRVSGIVTYRDGRVQEIDAGPVVLAEWELYAVRNNLPTSHEQVPMLYTSYVAYAAVTRGSSSAPAFDDWRATVDDITFEVDEATPTQAAPAA